MEQMCACKRHVAVVKVLDAAAKEAAAVPAALGVKPLLSHLARSPSVSLRHRLLPSGPSSPSTGPP